MKPFLSLEGLTKYDGVRYGYTDVSQPIAPNKCVASAQTCGGDINVGCFSPAVAA